ncbi:PAS domain S-box protein [bacterium]|nr:PAS domain S-box protein [bacterium]
MENPKQILFIDADEKYRRTAESALNHGLYDCRLCRNGEAGLASIAVRIPDVVIVDGQLEDMTGEEFYMRFLTDPRFRANRDVPFIVLTPNGIRNRTHYYNLGFSACLSKPFNASELVEFVEDVMVSHQLKMEEVNCWETIREAKDFLERVVESSAEAIVTTNTRGVVTYCNRAAEELFGVPFEEIVGKRVGSFMVNGNADLLKISALLKKRNKVQNYKILLLKRGGRRIPVNLSLSIMKDSAGKPMGTLSICKEIGAGQFAEYDKNESDRVTAVVETAVAVNHAINNPLVPILGNAQFLLQDERLPQEDIRRRLRVIVKNALRIRDITQKLANISHPVTKEYLKGTRMLDIEAST